MFRSRGWTPASSQPVGRHPDIGGYVNHTSRRATLIKTQWTQTHLIDCSKSTRTQNLHFLQLRLLQDPQLSLVRGRPAGGQGLHQLTKQTRHIKMVSDLLSVAAHSENIKHILPGTTLLIKLQSEVRQFSLQPNPCVTSLLSALQMLPT